MKIIVGQYVMIYRFINTPFHYVDKKKTHLSIDQIWKIFPYIRSKLKDNSIYF